MANLDTITSSSSSSSNVTAPKPRLTFYPAFCFTASPTHFAWVKIGAADVHRLKRRVEFGEQGLFFYQNHPIRFVNLVGVIVARTDVPRRTILTLDDSTGATIDIVVLKENTSSTPVPAPAFAPAKPQPSDGTDEKTAPKEMHVTPTTQSAIDISPLQPGKLFQVKGTLSVFRSMMQVQLERFYSVPDTKSEMRFVDARTRFLVDVLSVPWFLEEEDIERLRVEADEEGAKIEEEQARARSRGRRRAEREEKERKRIEKLWEREEVLREKEASVARKAGREFMMGIGSRKKTS
ncbi:hypothetical protein BDV18DRAFT_163078 [Aspergillus unguis]